MPSVNISEFTVRPARAASCFLMCTVLGRFWPDELCANQGKCLELEIRDAKVQTVLDGKLEII